MLSLLMVTGIVSFMLPLRVRTANPLLTHYPAGLLCPRLLAIEALTVRPLFHLVSMS